MSTPRKLARRTNPEVSGLSLDSWPKVTTSFHRIHADHAYVDSQQSDLPFHICVIKKFTVVSVVFVLGGGGGGGNVFLFWGGGRERKGGISPWMVRYTVAANYIAE